MKQKLKRTKGGFTLIEVIITIVVLAILAAMIASYYSQSFTHSSAPIASQIKYLGLNQVMEKISVQYAQYPHWRPQTTYASTTVILPPLGATKGFYYSSSGGISAATEPAPWPIIIGGISNTDGTINHWTCAGVAPTLTDLQTAIGVEGHDTNTTFGSYSVIDNHFITFDATNVEQPCTSSTTCIDNAHYLLDYGRYLKVTIGFRSDDATRTGETLATLFVLR